MKIVEGDIILLTKRKFSFIKIHRYLLSLFIRIFTGKYTHSAITFKKEDGQMYIREMDYKGSEINTTLDEYINLYRDRIYVMKVWLPFNNEEKIKLRNAATNLNVKYEFIGLVWQLYKSITGKFIGRKTLLKRVCSEDTARVYNNVRFYFEKPYEKTPMDLSENINFMIFKYK